MADNILEIGKIKIGDKTIELKVSEAERKRGGRKYFDLFIEKFLFPILLILPTLFLTMKTVKESTRAKTVEFSQEIIEKSIPGYSIQKCISFLEIHRLFDEKNSSLSNFFDFISLGVFKHKDTRTTTDILVYSFINYYEYTLKKYEAEKNDSLIYGLAMDLAYIDVNQSPITMELWHKLNADNLDSKLGKFIMNIRNTGNSYNALVNNQKMVDEGHINPDVINNIAQTNNQLKDIVFTTPSENKNIATLKDSVKILTEKFSEIQQQVKEEPAPNEQTKRELSSKLNIVLKDQARFIGKIQRQQQDQQTKFQKTQIEGSREMLQAK